MTLEHLFDGIGDRQRGQVNFVVIVLEVMDFCKFINTVLVQVSQCKPFDWHSLLLLGLHGELETPNSELVNRLMVQHQRSIIGSED